MASLAAASIGGYRALRALRAPSADTAPAPVSSAPPIIAAAPTPLADEAPREHTALAAASLPTALPDVASTPLPALPVPAAADTAAADPALSGKLVSLPEPASEQRVATAAAAPVVSASPAATATHSASTSWRLPRPKARKLDAVAPDAELTAVLPMPPPSESASASTALAAAPDLESAHALFRRANQLRQTDWDAAAALYERLTLRHSESPEAGVAEMALGKHALADGRAQQALRWFQAYQRREGGALAAEALWGEARAFQSLGEGAQAHELWQRLIDLYPASAYAAAAREQLGP
jgi:tetratricopeptide (TPR) repeat protein